MDYRVTTLTPANTPEPIGPYSHVAKAGPFINVSGTPGVNPATGQLAGPDAYTQTLQIIENFKVMLASVGAGLENVLHVNVFLKDVADFEAMNQAYIKGMGTHRPARTVIGVQDLPKAGARLTMNLNAISNS